MEKSTYSERLRVALAMRKACADKIESLSTHQPMADNYKKSADRERQIAEDVSRINVLDVIEAVGPAPIERPGEREAFEQIAKLENMQVNRRENGEYFYPLTARVYKIWQAAMQYKAEEPMTDTAPKVPISLKAAVDPDFRPMITIELEAQTDVPILFGEVAPPTLRLGQISERLGFTITADFLLTLGFSPAATEKNSKLFHEADFPRICAVLQRHIAAVQAKYQPGEDHGQE